MFDIQNEPQKLKKQYQKLSPILNELEEKYIYLDILITPPRMGGIWLKDKDNKPYSAIILMFYEYEENTEKRDNVAYKYGFNFLENYFPQKLDEVGILSFENFSNEMKNLSRDFYACEKKKNISQELLSFEQKKFLNTIKNYIESTIKKYNVSEEELIYFLVLSVIKQKMANYNVGLKNEDLENSIVTRVKGLMEDFENIENISLKPKKIITINKYKDTYE